MKCLNCGTRVKKSEEICPECGAYISKEKEYAVQPEDEINHEELEKAEEAVKHIYDSVPVKYDYNDYLLLPSLIRIGGGIVMMILSVVAAIDSSPFFRASSVYSVLLFIIAGILFAFNGISSIIQERKCVLTITDDRVFGTIPSGPFDTENIDIKIDDIIEVNETGFYSKNSTPKVHIVTAENEFTVKGSSKILLKDISDTLKNKIKKSKEKQNEN